MKTDNDLRPIEKIIFVGVLCALIMFSISIAVSGQTVSGITKNDVFPNLISKTTDIDGGTAVFEYNCMFSQCNIYKDLSVYFIKAVGYDISEYELYAARYVTEKEPQYDYVTTQTTCKDINNKDVPCDIQERVLSGYADVQKTIWDRIGNDYIVNQGTYRIKLDVKWIPHTGPQKIDFIPKATLLKSDYPTLDKDYSVEKSEWAWFNASWNLCKNITITEPGKQDRENEIMEFNLTGLTFGTGYPDEIRIVNAGCLESGTSQTYDIMSNSTDWADIITKVNVSKGASVNYSVYYDSDYYYAPNFDYEVYNFSVSGNIVVQWKCYHDQTCNATVDADGGVISTFYDEVNNQWLAVSGSMTGLFGTDEPQVAVLFGASTSTTTCAVLDNGYLFTDMNCTHNTKDAAQEFIFYSGTRIIKDNLMYAEGAAHGVAGKYSIYGGATGYYKGYNQGEIAVTGGWVYTTYNTSYMTQYNNSAPTRALLASWDSRWMQDDYAANARNSTAVIDTNYINIFSISGNGVAIIGPNNTTQVYQGVIEVTNGNEEEDGLAWHERLWNPNTYYLGAEQAQSAAIAVNITAPANGSSFAVDYINLNVTTDPSASACLYSLSGGSNISMYGSGTNWYIEVTGIPDGLKTIIVSCNSTGGTNWDDDNVSFIIDTTAPVITVFSPTNTTILNPTVNLNVWANETIDTWWYSLNGAANKTFTANTTFTANSGLNYITVWANDSINNIGGYGPVWFTLFNYTIGSSAYNSGVIEGSLNTFTASINFSDIGQVSNFDTDFIYDGTVHAATETAGGDGYQLTASVLINNITDSSYYQAKEFYWNFSFDYSVGSESNVSENETQTAYRVMVTNCSNATTTNATTLQFYLRDEGSGDMIGVNGTLDATFNVWYGNTYRNYSFAEVDNTTYSLCIYPTWAEYNISGTIEYNATGYWPRTYSLPTTAISNTSQDIDLYLLSESDANYVLIYVRDASDSGVPGVFLVVQKYDAGTGDYTNITSLETDDAGKALTILELNDAYYRFWVLDDAGTTLKITNKQVIPDTVDSPENIYIHLASSMNEWFQIAIGLTYNCTKDNIYNYTNCSIEDGSGLITSACLVVQWLGVNGFVTMCNSCNTTTPNSSLSCFLGSNANGTYGYSYYVTTTNNMYGIETGTILIPGSLIFGDVGILATIFMIMVMAGMALWRPEVAGLFAVGALIISALFGLIVVSIGSIVGLLLIAGIMIFTRR